MGKCQQKLSDGEICGLDTEADNKYCPFHENKVINEKTISLLENYYTTNNRNYLDLSDKIFEGIKFNRKILISDLACVFDRSIFRDCDFDSFNFHREVSFFYAEFYNSTFSFVSFEGANVVFDGATFHNDNVPFKGCRFYTRQKNKDDLQGVTFEQTTFKSNKNAFKECYIKSPKVSFIDAEINSDRFYIQVYNKSDDCFFRDYLTINSEEIYLDGLKFYGIFEYINHLDCKDFAPLIRFGRIDFSLMRSANFFEANLKKAYFTYSILDKVNFINTIWPEKRGKKILIDETKRLDKVTDKELLRIYLQLKKRYDQSGDFITSSDWYFREMEARRRLKPESSKYILTRCFKYLFSFSTWYRIISDYGENYKKALVWLLSVWFFPSIIYFYNGIAYNNIFIEYNEFLSFSFNLQNLLDFVSVLFFSAGAMALQVGRGLEMTSDVSYYTYIIQLLLTIIIVPLFLLALRRKFRR